MTDVNYVDLIVAARAADKSRDDIIMEIYETGKSLNAATKIYARIAKQQGYTTAIVSHKAEALELLRADYADGWDAQAVARAVVDLVAKFGVAESTARDYSKAHSEYLGVAHPTADPRAAMFQFLIDNAPHMSYDELKGAFKEFALDLGRSPSNINEYWKGYDLHIALTEAGA